MFDFQKFNEIFNSWTKKIAVKSLVKKFLKLPSILVPNFWIRKPFCGQTYKRSTFVIYNSIVILI